MFFFDSYVAACENKRCFDLNGVYLSRPCLILFRVVENENRKNIILIWNIYFKFADVVNIKYNFRR